MRKYIVTTLLTSLAGLAWRNRPAILNLTSKNDPNRSDAPTTGPQTAGASA